MLLDGDALTDDMSRVRRPTHLALPEDGEMYGPGGLIDAAH